MLHLMPLEYRVRRLQDERLHEAANERLLRDARTPQGQMALPLPFVPRSPIPESEERLPERSPRIPA